MMTVIGSPWERERENIQRQLFFTAGAPFALLIKGTTERMKIPKHMHAYNAVKPEYRGVFILQLTIERFYFIFKKHLFEPFFFMIVTHRIK